ncbi:aspartate/methionine/tyrosine aminotransferase [Arthrobacter sp. SORGH_AS 212]|nr:aspartate/methionine/tyrosine aminotransferase [Arthrobacter sp. SORGH_AS_0212]
MEGKFMARRNTEDRGNASQRFMRATGKLRAVFGPANRSALGHAMTEENRRLLEQRQAESQQWETITRPDGSTYVVPKDPGDKSLR